MLITSGELTALNYASNHSILIETVRRAADLGIELVQIREKGLSAGSVLQLALRALETVCGTATKILVNERLDIALAAGAHGVHLTSASIPVTAVRKFVPEGFLCGVSAHSVDEVKAARDGGADYVILGPIFSTPGKDQPLGVKRLREICAAVDPFSVIAVGGVDDSNVDEVLASGAAGFAAIRYLNDFVNMAE